MATDNSVDPSGRPTEQIGTCEHGVLRSMVTTMTKALMSGGGQLGMIGGGQPRLQPGVDGFLAQPDINGLTGISRSVATCFTRRPASTSSRTLRRNSWVASGHLGDPRDRRN